MGAERYETNLISSTNWTPGWYSNSREGGSGLSTCQLASWGCLKAAMGSQGKGTNETMGRPLHTPFSQQSALICVLDHLY
jgi:hypothetical protein